MPTYDYYCKSCKHELEIFHSMSEAPRRKCPACGKSALERKIGLGAAVLFKGSGFYQTDYRSASYKKGAEAEKPAESKSESKAESKPGEGKPAEKKTVESKPKKAEQPKDAA